MKMRSPLFRVGCVLLISTISAMAAGPPNRERAIQALYKAYQEFSGGNTIGGLKGVEVALSLDPNLAIAHIVRAEFAMQEQDWSAAQKHFETGLSHLKEPNQPLSPSPDIEIASKEVEGDTRCFLGYVYINLAQKASHSGDSPAEQKYLDLAHKSLKAGLALSPADEARELAEALLRMFK